MAVHLFPGDHALGFAVPVSGPGGRGVAFGRLAVRRLRVREHASAKPLIRLAALPQGASPARGGGAEGG